MATTQTGSPRFAGSPIVLGGETYVVPPLALGAVKELLPRVKAMQSVGGVPTPEDLDTMLDAALAAINRNYPAMTRDEVAQLIDLGNVAQMFKVVMGISGFEKRSPEQLEGNSEPGTVSP